MFHRLWIIALIVLAAAWATPARSQGLVNLLADAPMQPSEVAPLAAGFGPVLLAPTSGSIDCVGSGSIQSVVTMEEAVQFAITHNHDIKRLRFQVQAARVKKDETELLKSPTLQFANRVLIAGPAETAEIPDGSKPVSLVISTTAPTMTASLTLNQPIYSFGAFDLARRAAAINFEQASLQLARGQETIRNDVETAFLQVALTKALAEVASQSVATSQERLKIANERFDAGTAPKFETLRSEVSLATSQDQLLQTQTAYDLAMSSLVQKLGLPAGTTIEIAPPDPGGVDPQPPSMSLNEARDEALGNRSDLRAMQKAVDMAQLGIEASRNRPLVGFTGNYAMSDHAVGFQQILNWSVMLNLSFTVFDSGRSRTAMKEGTANREALKESVEQTRSMVALQVENTYHSLVNSLDRIKVAKATLSSASEAVRIAQIGYTEGVTPYIDYQDADLGYRQAETMYLQAVYGYLIAASNLEATIGKPFTSLGKQH